MVGGEGVDVEVGRGGGGEVCGEVGMVVRKMGQFCGKIK